MFVTEENGTLAFDENTIAEREEFFEAFRTAHLGLEWEKIAERLAGRATQDRVPVVLEPLRGDPQLPAGVDRHDVIDGHH